MKNNLSNLKKIGIGILSVPVTMFITVFLIKMFENIQNYVYKIDPTTIIYHDLYGMIWMIPFMASFIFSLLLSSVFISIVIDRKSIKKIIFYNIIFFVIWCGTLLIALPHYAYVTKEGICLKNSYFQDEKYYNWKEVRKVNGEFYSTIKGGEHFSYIFVLDDGNEYRMNFRVTDTNEELRKIENLIEAKKLDLYIVPCFRDSYLKLLGNK